MSVMRSLVILFAIVLLLTAAVQGHITTVMEPAGQLFYPSDDKRAAVSIDPPASPGDMNATATLYDPCGTQVGSLGPVLLKTANGYTNSLMLTESLGYYRMVVRVEEVGNPANYSEAETEFGIIPANESLGQKDYSSPFGVICHWGTDTAYETIKRLGIEWVRQDAADLVFDQRFVDKALAHNVCYMAVCKKYEGLPTALFAPTLASDPDFPRSGPGSWDYSEPVAFYRSMAANYGYGIDAYDLMNEPWNGQWDEVLGGGWNGGPWLETFADYGRQVAQAIHSKDPTSLIIWPENDLRFYDDFYPHGLAENNNVIGDHPYNVDPRNPWPEDQDIIAYHRDSWFHFVNNNHLPWRYWASEVGYSSFQNADPQAPRGRSNTLPQQAEMLVRMMVLQLYWGVEKIFWYDLYNDGPDPYEMENNFGLMRAGPKPAGVAYAYLIHKIKGWKRIARCHIGSGEQVHAYAWKQPSTGNLTMIAWIRDGSMSRTIPVSSTISQVTVTDIYGRSFIHNVQNKEIAVTLSSSPVYIDGLTEEDIAAFIHENDIVADAAGDFSITNGNPNGPWTYGQITTNINSQYTLIKYNTGTTVNVTTADGDIMPLKVWRSGSAADPGVHYNPNDDPIYTSDPFGSFWPPHTFSFHPGGTGQYSAVRWTAPAAGVYDISAIFRYGYLGGTSTYAYVVRNGSKTSQQNLFSGEVDAKNVGPFQTIYADELTLNAGETIDFAVNYGYDYEFSCDLTLADIVIRKKGAYPLEQVALTTGTNQEIVNTITPAPGTHTYYQGWQVKLTANPFAACGADYVFTQWVGLDIQAAYLDTTSVLMAGNKTITADFMDLCGGTGDCGKFLAGDLNKDCFVDISDLVSFCDSWLNCADPYNPECTTAP